MSNALVLAFRRKYLEFILARGGMRIKFLLYTLGRVPFLLMLSFLIMVVTVLLEILKPILKVNIILIDGWRIGNLVEDTELYLRHKVLYGKPKRELNLILLSGRPANYQLLTMIKRRLCVLEHPFFSKIHRLANMFLKNSKIWIYPLNHLYCVREYNEVSPQLSFTQEENLKGGNELLRMGIKPGDSFVCFHSRDRAYLNISHSYRSPDEWSYHDHRDSDIQNYLSAAEYLVSLGMFAIRMGYLVECPIKTTNPRIIDYAVQYRCDFMDVYLLANCKFFLGSNSGIISLATIFGVPLAAANWIPISDMVLNKHDLFIPMKLWSVERKRFITFREIINSGIDKFALKQQYVKAGIEVVENTKDEILGLAKEMNERLDNKWVATEEDEELQRRYKSLFPPHYYPCEVPSRIGAEFLLQNRELLE